MIQEAKSIRAWPVQTCTNRASNMNFSFIFLTLVVFTSYLAFTSYSKIPTLFSETAVCIKIQGGTKVQLFRGRNNYQEGLCRAA